MSSETRTASDASSANQSPLRSSLDSVLLLPFPTRSIRIALCRLVLDGATGTIIALLMLVAPAAAQAMPTPTGSGSGGASFLQVACQAGLGQLFTFVLTGAAVYVIAKGMVIAVIGWDRTQSGSGSKQKQGRQSMREGATQVAGGIFTPPMLIGVLNAMGVSLGCLMPKLGI